MSTTTERGKIVKIERLRNSFYGNPRHRVTLLMSADRVNAYNTAIDSQVAYTLGNNGIGLDDWVEVTIGGRGTITDIASVNPFA